MYKDMYEGDGPENPSITTRLTVLEGNVKTVTDGFTSLKLWAMGIIGTVLVETLVHLLKK